MNKSIITITDNGKRIEFTVEHDPMPTGPISTWHTPAITADRMVKAVIMAAKLGGLEPAQEMYKNSETGHVRITTREKEPKEHNGPEGTDTKADEHDAGTGGRIS